MVTIPIVLGAKYFLEFEQLFRGLRYNSLPLSPLADTQNLYANQFINSSPSCVDSINFFSLALRSRHRALLQAEGSV